MKRMNAGTYLPLFVVLVNGANHKECSIFYLSDDLQPRDMFQPRLPLSATAQRAGWQGFNYNLDIVREKFVRLR